MYFIVLEKGAKMAILLPANARRRLQGPSQLYRFRQGSRAGTARELAWNVGIVLRGRLQLEAKKLAVLP